MMQNNRLINLAFVIAETCYPWLTLKNMVFPYLHQCFLSSNPQQYKTPGVYPQSLLINP
jgi:hypothetical protein